MSLEGLRTTIQSLSADRQVVTKTLRLAVAAALDTPVGELRTILTQLSKLNRYEIHLVGPDETIQSMSDLATLHPAYLQHEIDVALGNLISSGGVDLTLLLPDPRRPEPSVQERLSPITGDSFLTGISLLYPEKLDRPLLLADTHIHDRPGHDVLEAIIRDAMMVARKVGIERPRTALLAAVEVASPGLPATMLEQEVAERFENDPDGYVQGPLSMDLAINQQAALKKKAKGEVPGRADILVAPSLTVARGVMHALHFGSGIPSVSVVVGAPVPVAVAQRGAETKLGCLATQLADLLR